MKNRIILPILFLGIVFGSSCNQGNEKKEITLASQLDSLSYCMGISIGMQFVRNIQQSPVDSIDIFLLTSSFAGTYNNDELLIDQEAAMQYLDRFFSKAMEEERKTELEKYKDNLEAGRKFLEENAKKEGVVVLPSGLQYEIIKNGRGAKPKPTDNITAHYHGTLIDGTVFDSSLDRDPLTIQLGQLIPGWIEAIQLMSPGAKWRLFVPYEMAYGEANKGVIKPYSALIFEVELISFKSPE
ncbi:MAG: FKBP-type peptidyl-prolyl cis-trans isomerase [Bacteroidetes bacterium]|nr:FKBP-type peptidyl-prolyl cis-trans isomerase [Bacteroidota bacterium]